MDDPTNRAYRHQDNSFRERLWRLIFLSESGPAKLFDIVLLWLIAGSVLVVMLETVKSVHAQYGSWLKAMEWVFTLLFTVEYITRLLVVRNKRRYMFSFFGIVDLLSILPTYLELFVAGSGHFIIIRVLRLLRMFRILKMAQFVGDANILVNALRASRSKIAVFIFALFAIVCIQGTLMYVIESGAGESHFTSIPQSIYWAIVTITTVGYGDITPITIPGKILASIIMVTGFAIIAVPTGIVTSEMHRELKEIKPDTRVCPSCGHEGHDPKALHCKMCGHRL
ncbi:MAG: ion transporter [Verrucomicrobiae bacterium]|nr:ion transporter [Verrucomicrobiae bacterium]